jgi:hypothetical protein
LSIRTGPHAPARHAFGARLMCGIAVQNLADAPELSAQHHCLSRSVGTLSLCRRADRLT